MSHNKRTSKILVTDVDRGSGLAILRSLAKKGWQVIAASKVEDAVGFWSRYASAKLVYPAPEEHPDTFIKSIKDYVQQQGIDLIIPVTDEVIIPLLRVRHEFENLCRIAMAESSALDVVMNKMKTLELARSLDIPVPNTHLLSSIWQAEQLSPTLTWPVVLKPLRSRLYTAEYGIEALSVTYANSAAEFLAAMRSFENRCDVLLQEYHHGDGVGVEMLLNEGQPVCAFQHHRLHEVPITGGASAFRESVEIDDKLYDYTAHILGALKWTGLAMVEFKANSESAVLMEINGRVWGSLPLAVHSGMDFPSRLADIYLDSSFTVPNQVDKQYRRGIRTRNLALDLVWMLSILRGTKKYKYLPMPSRWELIPALLGYLNPFYYMDVQSWNDPMPGLVQIPQIAKKIFAKASAT